MKYRVILLASYAINAAYCPANPMDAGVPYCTSCCAVVLVRYFKKCVESCMLQRQERLRRDELQRGLLISQEEQELLELADILQIQRAPSGADIQTLGRLIR